MSTVYRLTGPEITVSASAFSAVSGAQTVRVHIGAVQGKITIKDSVGNVLGSMTMHPNTSEVFRKNPTDVIGGTVDILATPVGFSN
jgi:hypothetical protein